MRYFLDTEFNDNVDPVGLISIGIVSEDNREFYAINQEYSKDSPSSKSCNEWVKINVLPHLDSVESIASAAAINERYAGIKCSYLIDNLHGMREGLRDFIGLDPFPEFWAYYGHYDWFLVTRLYKSFVHLPKGWTTACFDLHQYAKHYGLERSLPKKLLPQHHALVDARWTKLAFDHVTKTANKERKWP